MLAKVYVDLDGLGADWEGYVISQHFPTMTIKELNKHPERTQMLAEVYRKDPHLFYRLEPIPQYSELLAAIDKMNCKGFILTASGDTHPDPNMVRLDKTRWLSRYFNIPESQVIVTPTGEDKIAFASPHSVLLDDFDTNCNAFKAAGGHAILVEANTYDVKSLINELDNLVATINLVR